MHDILISLWKQQVFVKDLPNWSIYKQILVSKDNIRYTV